MAIAIGDIHGCLEPLKRLIPRLPTGDPLIFLGDYIDRGPETAKVIRFLEALAKKRSCLFLRGNHEDLMLKALDSNLGISNWVFNGGGSTLASYGLNLGEWKKTPDRRAFLKEHLKFFEMLELYAEDETHVFVHAGLDRAVGSMEKQHPETLLWVREKFFGRPDRWRNKTVVFGHTPTHNMGLGLGEVFQGGGIIGIDTGCVYGGKLTALDTMTGLIYQEASDYSYLTVEGPG